MAASQGDRDVRYAVIRALHQDDRIDATRVSVAVADRIVTLNGSVSDEATRTDAVHLARGVPGVVDVLDNLRVTAAGSRTDAEIAASVRADLARHANVNLARVTVDVYAGTVYLRGAVRTVAQKQLAAEVAWWTAGVRDVVDELRVEPVGQAASSA